MSSVRLRDRKRRCGWIDLVALKYAVMINGVSQLIMMKSDVLDTFDTIKACVAYKMNGVETNEFPYEIDDTIEPCIRGVTGLEDGHDEDAERGRVPGGVQRLPFFLGGRTGCACEDRFRRTGS